MTDHQQAAIEAAEDALRADIWDGDPEDIPPTMGREAELAVAAAEPHLRKKWVEEINDLMPGIVDDTKNDYARGVKAGINYVLAILEGAGE